MEKEYSRREAWKEKFKSLTHGQRLALLNRYFENQRYYDCVWHELNEDFFNIQRYKDNPMELVRDLRGGQVNLADRYILQDANGRFVSASEEDVEWEADYYSDEIYADGDWHDCIEMSYDDEDE
jgi:hypothetical protein